MGRLGEIVGGVWQNVGTVNQQYQYDGFDNITSESNTGAGGGLDTTVVLTTGQGRRCGSWSGFAVRWRSCWADLKGLRKRDCYSLGAGPLSIVTFA